MPSKTVKRRPKRGFVRLLTISDLHCGNALGLTPPEWWHDDVLPHAKIFWDYFTEVIDAFRPFDGLIINGDAIDGSGRKESGAMITTDYRKQVKMVLRILEFIDAPWVEVVRGTGYHTDIHGVGTNCEDFIADALGVEAQDELRLEVHKRRLQWRHVVGRSDIPYGQYTQLAKAMIAEILQAHFEAYDDADAVIRSHVHYHVATGVSDGARGITRKAITTPGLQLRGPPQTGFTRRLPTWLYHVGVTPIDIYATGRLIMEPEILPIRMYWRREYKCLTPSS